ncbi:MAG: hypothetical protein ABI763_04630 [Bacteroidota bacterium]
MKIAINDRRKIFAIQSDFNETFPYLRLDFFATPHEPGRPSTKKIIRHASKTLGECRTIHKSGTITITPGMTVTDLEQNFSSVYGLSVQIFRKSGRAWLETTVTDGWTLEEQNRQGEELSKAKSATGGVPDENQFE